jgi:aerobic-type carbon monoxide dehydrogenase small subunit (CoxS/CutS family)
MNDPATVVPVTVEVNGERHETTVEARTLLVHLIRDTLGLKGTHIGCDTGNCGACTVLVDGEPIKSCMALAAQVDGASVTTVEGLSQRDGLTDLQQAFNEHHAVQCGYCTPGVLVSATALLERNSQPSEEEIRRALKGNICRCTGYVNIVEAVRAAAGEVSA